MIAQKLYMAVWVDSGIEYEECYEHDGCACFEPIAEPAGWREYALERWGTEPREGEYWPEGHKPFFWPKTNVPYLSRSTAQRRVDIINYWGGKAEVVECTPVWESVTAANLRRKAERFDARIAKKQAEVEELARQRDIALGLEAVAA